MMKPATFDGNGSWMDYTAHFEACAELNNWTKEQKGLGAGKHNYDELVTTLEDRFAPPNQTELYRVQLRDC